MTKRKVPRWLQAARQATTGPALEKPDWASRVLGRAGRLPEHGLDGALRSGRITLDGTPIRDAMVLVRPGARLAVDGIEVPFAPPTRVLAFHKPVDTVTAVSDPNGLRTVFEALREVLPEALQGFGWHAVGRLDRDTSGLLLFTSDERFVEHATRPETHLPKRYVAEVGADATEEKLAPLRAGLELDDGKAAPAQTELRGPRTVALTLTEGRFHQVKRMLGAVGLPVRALHREAIGSLLLDVEVGRFRELTLEEIRGALRFEGARG